MAYEPTNWKAGDVVTSAKLNKIEQGIAAGGGVLIAHDEDGTLDKTWQEINDADICFIQKKSSYVHDTILVLHVSQYMDDHYVIGVGIQYTGASSPLQQTEVENSIYQAQSADAYPSLSGTK